VSGKGGGGEQLAQNARTRNARNLLQQDCRAVVGFNRRGGGRTCVAESERMLRHSTALSIAAGWMEKVKPCNTNNSRFSPRPVAKARMNHPPLLSLACARPRPSGLATWAPEPTAQDLNRTAPDAPAWDQHFATEKFDPKNFTERKRVTAGQAVRVECLRGRNEKDTSLNRTSVLSAARADVRYACGSNFRVCAAHQIEWRVDETANLVSATRRAARTGQHVRTHPQRQVDARVVAAVPAFGQTLALEHNDIENTRHLSCGKHVTARRECAKPSTEMAGRRTRGRAQARGSHAYRCDDIALAVFVQGNHVRHRRYRSFHRLAPPV